MSAWIQRRAGSVLGILTSLLLGAAAQAGDLVVPALSPALANIQAGSSVEVGVVVRNLGTSPSGTFKTRLVLSSDARIDTSDFDLGVDFDLNIKPGETETRKPTVIVPAALTPGSFYLGAIADINNDYQETREDNNTNSVIVQITPSATALNANLAELVVLGLQGPAQARPGDKVSVALSVGNIGQARAGVFACKLRLSQNAQINGSDPLLADFAVIELKKGQAITRRLDVTLPARASGNYVFALQLDSDNTVAERDENNNLSVSSRTIAIQSGPTLPPLAPGALGLAQVTRVLPSSVPANASITLTLEGSGFSGASRVFLVQPRASIAASGLKVSSDTRMEITIPAIPLTGAFQLQVTNPQGTNAASQATLTLTPSAAAPPTQPGTPQPAQPAPFPLRAQGAPSAPAATAATPANLPQPITSAGRQKIFVGGVWLEADHIENVDATTKRAFGNVTLNGSINISGEAYVDLTQDSLTFRDKANIFAQPLKKEIQLWDGGDYLVQNGSLISRRLKKNPLKFKIGGLGVTWKKLEILKDGVGFGGEIKLPENMGSLSIDAQRITITQGDGVQVHVKVGLPTIPIPGGYSLRKTYIEYNQYEDIWEGSATLKLPKSFGIVATVGIKSGMLNKVGFGVDYLNYLLYPTPPIMVQKIYGELDHLAPGPPAIRLRALIEFTAGPKVAVGARNYALVTGEIMASIDVDGRLAASGKLKIINDAFQIAAGKIIYEKSYGIFIQGELTFFKILDVDGRIRLDPQGKLQGSLKGTFYIPKKVPLIGGIDIGQAVVYVDDTRLLTGVQVLWMTYVVQIDKGGKISTGGNLKNISTIEVVPPDDATVQLLRLLSGIPVSTAGARVKEGAPLRFTQDGRAPWSMWRVSWKKEGGFADMVLVRPDGRRLRAGNCDPEQGAYYRSNPEAQEVYISVKNPEAGAWQVLVEGSAKELGGYTVTMDEPDAPVEIPAIECVQQENVYRLSWKLRDPDGGYRPQVSVYLDEDGEGHDGITLAQNLDGVEIERFDVDAASLPSGDHRLYIKVDDGRNHPVFAYAPLTLRVASTKAPAAPEGFSALPQGPDAISLKWNKVEGAAGYRALLTSRTGAPDYEQEVYLDEETEFSFTGLAGGRAYRVAVAAVNAEGDRSRPSRAHIVELERGANAAPRLLDQMPTLARVGQDYEGQMLVADADGDAVKVSLERAPAGMILDERLSALAWRPTADQLGRHEVIVRLDDGRDGLARESFVIHVAGAQEGAAAPEILSELEGGARLGHPYRAQLRVAADGAQPVSTEVIEAPKGLVVSTTGEISWVPAKDQGGLQTLRLAATTADGRRQDREYRLLAADDLSYGLTRGGSRGCFVVTASLADEAGTGGHVAVVNHVGRYIIPEERLADLEALRELRDGPLAGSETGRSLIRAYYQHGPEWARYLMERPSLRLAVRLAVVKPSAGLARLAAGRTPSPTSALALAAWLLVFLSTGFGLRRLLRRAG